MRRNFLDDWKMRLERCLERLTIVPAKCFTIFLIRGKETRIAGDHEVIQLHELNAKILRRKVVEYCCDVVKRMSLPQRKMMHYCKRQHHLTLEPLDGARYEIVCLANQRERRLILIETGSQRRQG